MKFVERKAKDQFKKGDVIRFKDRGDTSYHYAIIADTSNTWRKEIMDEFGLCLDYSIIILNDYEHLCAGVTYRSGSMKDLKEGMSDWDIVQVVKTETRVLTD